MVITINFARCQSCKETIADATHRQLYEHLTEIEQSRKVLKMQLEQEQVAKHRLLDLIAKEANERRQLTSLYEMMKAKAADLERELTSITSGVQTTDHKFRQMKVVLSKKLHPNSFPGAGTQEVRIREKIFKEIWPEIERIGKV